MSRWEPDARGRLERAALELYSERGFEQTTVDEIARRTGLTERTFFRHFADKREVLFGGAEALQEFLVTAVTDAPASVGPIDAVASAVEALDVIFEGRRAGSRQRQRIIASNPDLQERELIKLARLTTSISAALRRRGVNPVAASLAAEIGIAVFKTAFELWIEEDAHADFASLVRESLTELRAVTSGEHHRTGLPVTDSSRVQGL